MSDTSKAVFLSYASQDAEAAKRICDALRAAGVEVWFDQSELVGGDAWDQKIRKQIRECALLIPIISAATQARTEGYFRLEWRLADQRTHLMAKGRPFLLPVVVDGTRDAEAQVPDSFTEVQWTKAAGGEVTPAFCARVKKLLGGGTAENRSQRSEVGGQRTEDGASERAGNNGNKPKRWLAPVIAGAVVALLALVIARPWEKKAPVAVVSEATSEIAAIRSQLRPDEWTRADFDALVPTIDRLIQANPENSDAWAMRGIANSLIVIRNLDTGTKPLQMGKEASDRALRLAPKSPLAELSLGLHLVAMISRGGDVHAPRLHIERGLAGLPAGEALSRYADLCSYWLGYQFEGTDRSARAWLAAEPSASFPAWILAQAGLVRRQPAEALKWAEQAASDPDITGTRALVTMFEVHYYLQADLKAAQAALDRVPAGQRSVHRELASRWLVAMAGHHYDQALQELNRTPDAVLRDRVFHGPKALLAGLAHESAGRADAARDQFGEAEKVLRAELALDPDNQELRAVLALSLACLGRKDESRRELAAVEPLLNGQDPTVYTGHLIALIAQVHGVLGEIDQMIPWLRCLFTKSSQLPYTPTSLRLDPRFGRYVAEPAMQTLLAEFTSLDQPVKQSTEDRGPKTEISLPVDQKSVAVLAFANLSDDKGNEYFSDGISEELLNVLAKVPGLKVTARTSSFHFKGKDTSIPEIAKQLGVAYVVEGSVRKSGDKVRITAQLIKAADGFHVWSDTFTRDMKDIFAVQDEIAGLIAKNLEVKMGMVAPRTAIDPAALDDYLAGRASVESASVAGLKAGIAHFEKVLAVQPDFAPAWVQLARAHLQLGRWGGMPVPQAWAGAQRAIARAIELEPDSPDALVTLGWVLRTAEWKWRDAERAFRRALELRPHHADTLAGAAVLLFNLGKTDEAFRLAHEAVALDPLNAATQLDLTLLFLFSRRFQEAEASARRALQLAPGGQLYRAHIGAALEAQGRFDEAEKEVKLEPDEATRRCYLALIEIGRGHTDAARVHLRRIEEIATSSPETADLAIYIASIHARLGDKDRAFAVLEQSANTRDPSNCWLRNDIELDSLRDDPRFVALLHQVGLADDQLK